MVLLHSLMLTVEWTIALPPPGMLRGQCWTSWLHSQTCGPTPTIAPTSSALLPLCTWRLPASAVWLQIWSSHQARTRSPRTSTLALLSHLCQQKGLCASVCGACAWILWDGRQWCCQAGKWGWQSGRRSWAYMGEGAKGMDDPWMLWKYGASWGAACGRCRESHAWREQIVRKRCWQHVTPGYVHKLASKGH